MVLVPSISIFPGTSRARVRLLKQLLKDTNIQIRLNYKINFRLTKDNLLESRQKQFTLRID